MLISSHTQNAIDYFQKSTRFFYLIVDAEANLIYANPFLCQELNYVAINSHHEKIERLLPAKEAAKFKEAVKKCIENPGTACFADLILQTSKGVKSSTRWEISAITNKGVIENIQSIGYIVNEPGRVIAKPGHGTGELMERYRISQQRTGLWMYETDEPISITLNPTAMLSFWKENAYVAECNDNLAQMHGFNSAEEIIGKPLNKLIDFEDTFWIDYLQLFIKNGFKLSGLETKGVDKNGHPVNFVVNMEGVIEKGSIKKIWGFQYDITEQKKTTEQVTLLSKLVESVSDIIVSKDKNYKIISWNKAAEAVYGYSVNEVLGRKIDELVTVEFENTPDDKVFEILNKEGEWRGEKYFTNKDGKAIALLSTITKLQDDKGETTGYISVSKDITEKRKMEEQSLQNQLFYRNLFSNSLDGVLLTDEWGTINFASPSITPILGFSDEEVIGKSIFDYTHSEEKELAIAAFREEIAGEPKQSFISIRLLKKSGDWLWSFVRGHSLLDNRYVKGVVIYFYDDTMRKETETALIASEERFRNQATILNNVTDVILSTGMDRVIVSWNPVLEKLSGISKEEAAGKFLKEILTVDYSPFSQEEAVAIAFQEGIWRGEISFTGRSGEKVYLLHTISIIYDEEGNKAGLLGIGKDITERKEAELKLQQSEQFFRGMSYYSFDGIVMSDAAGKISYCGPSVPRISGYQAEQLLGRNFFDFVHPDEMTAATSAFTQELNNQSATNYIYLRLKHARDSWLWCTVRTHNLLTTPGFNAIVIYFTNDTKRKLAEDRLRKSEENFRNLIYNLKQGVVLYDENGEMTIHNQAVLCMLALTKEQLTGKEPPDPSWNLIHEDGSIFPDHTYLVSRVLRTHEATGDVVMGVYNSRNNGQTWLLVNAEPVFAEGGEIINVVCSFTDITEQKRLSKELIKQEVRKQKLITQATIDGQEKERLEIGKELHDNINQHLTTTRLYLEVAYEKASGELREMIDLSHKNLVNIITNIRTLSHSLVPPTLGDIGLVESLQDLCDSLKAAHKFNIDFFCKHFNEEHLPENLKLMLFRVTQEQVNNIVSHAKASAIQIKLQSDAEYIILTIIDDGEGFDPSNYVKGLGLRNIVNRASLFNGRVEINSARSKGCVLTVIVPFEATQPAADLI